MLIQPIRVICPSKGEALVTRWLTETLRNKMADRDAEKQDGGQRRCLLVLLSVLQQGIE